MARAARKCHRSGSGRGERVGVESRCVTHGQLAIGADGRDDTDMVGVAAARRHCVGHLLRFVAGLDPWMGSEVSLAPCGQLDARGHVGGRQRRLMPEIVCRTGRVAAVDADDGPAVPPFFIQLAPLTPRL